MVKYTMTNEKTTEAYKPQTESHQSNFSEIR